MLVKIVIEEKFMIVMTIVMTLSAEFELLPARRVAQLRIVKIA